MNKVKMIVEIVFPEHDETIDGETVHIQTMVHKFGYNWKSRYHREPTDENRDFIIKIVREDRDDDIAMRIKQVISMYQDTTGATMTKHIVNYTVDFNA